MVYEDGELYGVCHINIKNMDVFHSSLGMASSEAAVAWAVAAQMMICI